MRFRFWTILNDYMSEGTDYWLKAGYRVAEIILEELRPYIADKSKDELNTELKKCMITSLCLFYKRNIACGL